MHYLNLFAILVLLFSCEKKNTEIEKERFPLTFQIVNNSDSIIGAHIEARVYYPEEDFTWIMWRNCSRLLSNENCMDIVNDDSAYIGCEYQFFASIFKYIPEQSMYLKWTYCNGLDTIKNSTERNFIFEWPKDSASFMLTLYDTIPWDKKSLEIYPEPDIKVKLGRMFDEE